MHHVFCPFQLRDSGVLLLPRVEGRRREGADHQQQGGGVRAGRGGGRLGGPTGSCSMAEQNVSNEMKFFCELKITLKLKILRPQNQAGVLLLNSVFSYRSFFEESAKYFRIRTGQRMNKENY